MEGLSEGFNTNECRWIPPREWIVHERLWIEMSPDNSSYESAITYFKSRMYVKRDMALPAQLKDMRDSAIMLWSYRNKIVGLDCQDRAVGVSLCKITY